MKLPLTTVKLYPSSLMVNSPRAWFLTAFFITPFKSSYETGFSDLMSVITEMENILFGAGSLQRKQLTLL